MERIFNNTKLKKILVVFFICTIIFSYISPYFVFADNKNYSLKGAIDYVYSVTGSSFYNSLKTSVELAIKDKIGEKNYKDDDVDKALIYCYDKVEWIYVSSINFREVGTINSKVVDNFEVKIGDNFNIQTIRNDWKKERDKFENRLAIVGKDIEKDITYVGTYNQWLNATSGLNFKQGYGPSGFNVNEDYTVKIRTREKLRENEYNTFIETKYAGGGYNFTNESGTQEQREEQNKVIEKVLEEHGDEITITAYLGFSNMIYYFNITELTVDESASDAMDSELGYKKYSYKEFKEEFLENEYSEEEVDEMLIAKIMATYYNHLEDQDSHFERFKQIRGG